MDVASVRTALAPLVDESVNCTHQTYTYPTSPPAEDLQEAGVITETAVEQHVVVFSAGGMELARCEYIDCVNEDVAYIQDVEVAPEYRSQGFGTALRGAVVDDLAHRGNTIYSYPTNETIIRIAEKQGFRPATNLSYAGWYVRP